jgi:hypothetical protein
MSNTLRVWLVLALTVVGATAIVAGISGKTTMKEASLAMSKDR